MACNHTDACKEAAYKYNGLCPVCQHDRIRPLERQLEIARKVDDSQVAFIRQMQAALEECDRQLTNLQPHLGQLDQNSRGFIDAHVDMALEAVRKALNGCGREIGHG